MNSLLHWLSMGDYALFVWPAYGIVITILMLNVAGCRWQKKRIKKSLKTWYKRISS